MVAAAPDTWHDAPPPATDGRVLQRRFRALQAEVRTARRIQMTWALGLGLLALTVLPQLMTAVLLHAR